MTLNRCHIVNFQRLITGIFESVHIFVKSNIY